VHTARCARVNCLSQASFLPLRYSHPHLDVLCKIKEMDEMASAYSAAMGLSCSLSITISPLPSQEFGSSEDVGEAFECGVARVLNDAEGTSRLAIAAINMAWNL
jgi:hypothetical protein